MTSSSRVPPAAEAAGDTGIMGMDRLAPPLADGQPMYEATVTSTSLAAHTERMLGRARDRARLRVVLRLRAP